MLGAARNAGGDVAKAKPQWWVYVLRCRDGTLYTGVTTDCDRRLAQHNAGKASKYTRARRPVQMVYRERAAGHGEALRREFAIKKLPRAAKETLIEPRRKRA
jgi:putative endonuclease